MQFIKSIILIVISLLVILFSVLAFQKLYSLQQTLYTIKPSEIASIPEIISNKFQTIYVFFSITLVIAVLAFIYFAFIDISKEFKLAVETKRAKEEEIVKEDIDLGELEEEITVSDIERKKREKLNSLRNKIRKIYNTKENSKTEICESILSLIGKEIEIVQGEIFLLRNENNENYTTFELTATYAYFIPEEQKIEFEFGDGLVGQVAKGQEPLYIENVPDDYIKVASGLGQATPNKLLILPIIKDQVTIGVMELASFKEINESEVELLGAINEEVGNLFGEKMSKIIAEISAKRKIIIEEEEKIEEIKQNAISDSNNKALKTNTSESSNKEVKIESNDKEIKDSKENSN